MNQNHNELVGQVRHILDKVGFFTSDPLFLTHSGFDIVARRDSLIIVVKVQGNIDSVERKGVTSMLALARAVSGAPLIIAVKSSTSTIEDGVVYSRYSVPVLTINTLADLFLEGVPPMVYSAPGGFFVRMDTNVLRTLRGKGASLGELAEMAGVSRRTIQMYEDGMGAKLEVALRMEEALGIELISPIDPLSKIAEGRLTEDELVSGMDFSSPMKDIFEHLSEMGYSVQPFSKCPFDALTSDRKTILFTGIGKLESCLGLRARAIANISKLLERRAVLFVEERKNRTSLEGAPLITYLELERIGDKKKIIQIIEERGVD